MYGILRIQPSERNKSLASGAHIQDKVGRLLVYIGILGDVLKFCMSEGYREREVGREVFPGEMNTKPNFE